MRKNTYNSNVICGSSRTRLRPIADCTERGYCLQKEILSELQTKSYLLGVIALGSVLVCPVEVFSWLAVTLLHVKLNCFLQASVDSLDDITFVLLKDAFVDVRVHLLVHEVPQLREVVILEKQTERRTQNLISTDTDLHMEMDFTTGTQEMVPFVCPNNLKVTYKM